MVRRLGVIKGIDTSIGDEDLKELIKPISGEQFTILQVKRLNRRKSVDNENIYIPTQSVLVTFRGQKLPSAISVFRVICSVEPYIQKVVQCLKCLRYGHISTHCKANSIRCAKCSENHETASFQTSIEVKCVHCNGQHLSTDHAACPEYSKQKSIKNIMSYENISYRDACNKYKNSFSNAVINPTPKPNDFPELSSATIKPKRRYTESLYSKDILNTRAEHKKIISNSHINIPNGAVINNSGKPYSPNCSQNNISTAVNEIYNTISTLCNPKSDSLDFESVTKQQIEDILKTKFNYSLQ